MITENYVSFETAKLLKEKGFDEKCVSVYHDGEIELVSSLGIFSSEGYGEQILTYTNSECEWSPIMVSAPTLQMAMKWLREIHNYYIQVMLDSWALGDHTGYYIVIQKTNDATEFMLSDKVYKVFYETPEQAIEAAIRYILENLI